jgi:glutathione S-transferase
VAKRLRGGRRAPLIPRDWPRARALLLSCGMSSNSSLRFVDLETARASRGLRLAVITSVPSLWSDAARGMVLAKELECLAVEFDVRDASIAAWTGCPNAPVALYGDELPRTGWAEIVTLLERLGGRLQLVPDPAADRVAMFGLSHEVCGEMGVSWIRRLLLLHASFTTNGGEGFPLPVAKYLARRYGYSADLVLPARQRLIQILAHLGEHLERSAGPFFFGSTLTALDFHSAAAMGSLVPVPDAIRPIIPSMRPVFEQLDPELREAIPPALLAHRDRIAPRYFALSAPTA